MRSMCRTVLVALVAVLAVGAVASAAASAALPEFQQGGKGLAKAVKFTATGGETAFVGLYSGTTGVLTCENSTMSGETHGVSEVTGVVVKFTGCIASHGACTSPGAKSGEMVTAQLSGRIGYLPKKENVGLLLEQAKGEKIAECTDSLLGTFHFKGSVIGGFSPINKETKEFDLAFKASPSGSTDQEWTHFEGEEVLHSLESYLYHQPYTAASIETGRSIAITSTETMEVKA